MRIVIDMQGVQTEWHLNGIGGQAMAFVQAVVHNAPDKDVILALNGFMPEAIEPIRAAFEGVLPQEHIRIWNAPGPIHEADPASENRRDIAELVREAFLASLKPDIIHITRFFIGYAENAVTSVGRFDAKTPVSVMLHGDEADSESQALIESNSNIERFHARKIQQLKDCSLLTAVPGAYGTHQWAQLSPEGSLRNVLELTYDPRYRRESATQWPSGTATSWDSGGEAHSVAAQEILQAWEQLFETQKESKAFDKTVKPRMAYVSPLPPQKTGIADYSSELLPALTEYYEITAITDGDGIDTSRVNQQVCEIQGVEWLRDHASEFDRVLYHVGNSPFHGHMLSLIKEIPGTVVLHDFYLGDLMHWLETKAGFEGAWTQALYDDHGYTALKSGDEDLHGSVKHYPVNFEFLRQATGIISHSDYSRELATAWYSPDIAKDWAVIPHLRSAAETCDDTKKAAKRKLGFSEEQLLICCFGVLSPLKLNRGLLKSWLDTELSQQQLSSLVFVGQDNDDDYTRELKQVIDDNDAGGQVRMTGFAPYELFHDYLAACDIAVQLRTQSRGETSGTVLDCMNHGVPTIVNANGTMRELDPDSVWMLPDDFTTEQLKIALETLAHDESLRKAKAECAQEVIRTQHRPEECAALYHEVIEHFHENTRPIIDPLIQAAAVGLEGIEPDNEMLMDISESIAHAVPEQKPKRTLYVDISATCRNDLGTGIERTARALVMELLKIKGSRVRIEPVYLDHVNGRWCHRFARAYTLRLIDCPLEAGEDEIVDPQPGDMMVGLDLCGVELVQAQRQGLFSGYRNSGVAVYFMIHDLLPVRMPEVFPPGAGDVHAEWLYSLSTFDGIIGVTETVARDYCHWLSEQGIDYSGRRSFAIRYSHHGADVSSSSPTRGLPDDAEDKLAIITSRPTFLLVGTIEPRKGYLETINAFSSLWEQGIDANLVIVGNEGWTDLPEPSRRDIPETIERLTSHPEYGARLFWLKGISDEYLEKVYAASTCLIAASYGEGFGLPLIEAAQYQKPIIARDIPVFREVAGDYAFYFNGNEPGGLEEAVRRWLELYDNGQHPRSQDMPWLSWEQSAANLLSIVLNEPTCHRAREGNILENKSESAPHKAPRSAAAQMEQKSSVTMGDT